MASEIKGGNVWFRRFYNDCKRLSPHVRFKRIKFGFYRIYFQGAYVGECYDNMPPKGYDKEEDDVRFMNQSYYEEYEDSAKMTRQVKNFVEGYYDLMNTFKTRIYLLKNNREYRDDAKKAYAQFYVK